MNIVKTLKKILLDLSIENSCIKAIALNGSYAVNRQTDTSDIDFVIIVDSDNAIQQVESKLKAMFEFEKYFHEVPHFKYEDKEVCFCIYNEDWYKKTASNLFSSKETLLKWQSFIQHKLVETDPVHDPERIFFNLKENVGSYPPELAQETVKDSLNYLRSEFIEDWGFKNSYHFAFSLQDILEHIAKAFYASHRKLFMPPLKRFQTDIAEVSPDLHTLLLNLVCIDQKMNYVDKKEILQEICEKILV